MSDTTRKRDIKRDMSVTYPVTRPLSSTQLPVPATTYANRDIGCDKSVTRGVTRFPPTVTNLSDHTVTKLSAIRNSSNSNRFTNTVTSLSKGTVTFLSNPSLESSTDVFVLIFRRANKARRSRFRTRRSPRLRSSPLFPGSPTPPQEGFLNPTQARSGDVLILSLNTVRACGGASRLVVLACQPPPPDPSGLADSGPTAPTTRCSGHRAPIWCHNRANAARAALAGVYGICECNILFIMRRWGPPRPSSLCRKIPHMRIDLALLPPSHPRRRGGGLVCLVGWGFSNRFSNSVDWSVGGEFVVLSFSNFRGGPGCGVGVVA